MGPGGMGDLENKTNNLLLGNHIIKLSKGTRKLDSFKGAKKR